MVKNVKNIKPPCPKQSLIFLHRCSFETLYFIPIIK